MKRITKSRRKFKQQGIALLAAMVFVAIFSAFSIGMLSMSSSNIQIADNHHKSNLARSCAESGMDFVRYWLDQVDISGFIDDSERYELVMADLQTHLQYNNIYFQNQVDTYGTFSVGMESYPINLNQNLGQSFYANIQPVGTTGVLVQVTGRAGELESTIQAQFTYGVREHTVFDFGVATKGPLNMQGNILLDGVNISVESDVYIESESQDQALSIIGNSQIAGDVKITNPDAYVILQGGQAGIGGETGQAAIDNHVEVGVPPTEFPMPDTASFEGYVDGITINSTNVGTYTTGGTFENIRIAAGTNPTFSGDVTLNGVVFIETPNQVTFTGNADITGIIVGDGNVDDHSGTNTIDFQGNVSSNSVANLSVEQYGSLTQETGTFIMAPGFAVSMGGSFGTLNGCIAANGINFYGNAGGTIGGSVINYSPNPMTLSGNSDLFFNKSGTTTVPAGFVPEIVFHYDASSYGEIH